MIGDVVAQRRSRATKVKAQRVPRTAGFKMSLSVMKEVGLTPIYNVDHPKCKAPDGTWRNPKIKDSRKRMEIYRTATTVAEMELMRKKSIPGVKRAVLELGDVTEDFSKGFMNVRHEQSGKIYDRHSWNPAML